MKRAKAVGFVAFLIIVTCVLWAWYLRGTRHLCGGYHLVWMNGAEAVVTDPNKKIVTRGTVAHYASSCPLITGYTSRQGFPADTEPVEGYFVIDTDTGVSTLGMTEAEWSERLRLAHWKQPSMHATHPTKLPATANDRNR